MLYINREKDVYENYTYREREISGAVLYRVREGCTLYRKRECKGELQLDKRKEGCTGELYSVQVERRMFRSDLQDERRMFRRAVQAQRGGCSGELYRHRERDVQK